MKKRRRLYIQKANLEPDEDGMGVVVLKSFLITSNNQRRPSIYFTEPAKCPLMCACKGSKTENLGWVTSVGMTPVGLCNYIKSFA